MKTALLYSGGLDSACAYWHLGKPEALYFGGRYGPARYANAGEVAAVHAHKALLGDADNIRALEFDFRPFMRNGSWVLPRHQLCVMLAWAAGYDHLMFAWVKEDGTTEEARDNFKAKFEGAVDGRVTVDFPVLHMSKTELIHSALAKGATPEFLRASHSCLSASRHCHNCRNCKERDAALEAAGVKGDA